MRQMDLTEGVIWKKLMVYAVPVILSSFLQSAYSITDLIVAGWFVGKGGISAINNASQVMLLVGTDDGGASFPDWTEHLALAMSVTREMNALWPGLARPITLRTARFNQQLTKGSLLVEVGSHGNTLEEAVAGSRLFARALGRVLLNYVAAE